eukprot:XP_001702627.1 predicted protein [Chlamydomonas reinhardtii]
MSGRSGVRTSLADSHRDVPTEAELCGFTWNLAFKFIPWFSAAMGSLTVRRYFQTNHTLTAPPADPLWGDSEPQRHYWYFREVAPGAADAAAEMGPQEGEGGAPVAPLPVPRTLLQVNTYPPLTCSRTADWGWELQNAMVRLSIDTAAGPNPGLPPGHPAARETMTLQEIRDLEDTSEEEESEAGEAESEEKSEAEEGYEEEEDQEEEEQEEEQEQEEEEASEGEGRKSQS